MKEVFKTIIKDFITKDLSGVRQRNYDLPLDISKIVSIIGARRTGKTYLMFGLINRLSHEISRENLIYVNFEDDRLFPLKLENLSSLIDSYYELFPGKKNEKVWFFFDEVHNVPNWELFIRRIYDTENCRIYITGSSSKLLSKEIATSLRGRTLTYTIYPYSFKEYISLYDAGTDLYTSAGKASIVNHFNKYCTSTAFPELTGYDQSTRENALHDYFNLIIYKDLVERFNISNHFLVKYFLKFLLINISNPISVTKCFNDFKSQGLQVSRATLFEYLDHISDAFIIFPVSIFSDNFRDRTRNPVKIYSIDTGLSQLFTTNFNAGRVIENIVFLELKRRTGEIFYFKNKQETDFLVNHGDSIELINVSSNISQKSTKDREISGLISAMNDLKINNSLLITLHDEETIKSNNKIISIVPVWKWLINKF